MTWLGDAKRNIVCWASETWREKRRPDWRPVTYCLRGRKKKGHQCCVASVQSSREAHREGFKATLTIKELQNLFKDTMNTSGPTSST